MNVLKKLLLISTVSLFTICNTWAMETSQEFTVRARHSVSNIEVIPEEREQPTASSQLHIIPETNTVLLSSGQDFPYQSILQGFNNLPLLALPQLPPELVYVKDEQGQFYIGRIAFSNEPFNIIVFGPSNEGLINYRTDSRLSSGYQPESFAFSKTHISSEKRKKMRSEMAVQYKTIKGRKDIINKNTPEAGLNRCHNIDLQYMIPQVHNSNKDGGVFFPGCEELNQHIQGSLTSSLAGIPGAGVGLICLYDEIPPTIQQRIRLGYRNLTNWQPINVPAGIIHKHVFSNETGEVFYFPHDVGNNPQELWPTHTCLYKRLLKQKGGYNEVADLFRIQNAMHLFKPLIIDFQLSQSQSRLDIYKTFFVGFNLLPHVKTLEGLKLLDELDIPVAVNFMTGYTPQETKEIAHLIHSKKPIPPELASRYPYWNDFQIPILGNGRWKWVTDINLIPLFSESIEQSHQTKFLRYTGLRKVEEAAKAQFDSVRLKLTLVDLYYLEEKYKKAKEWFSIAYGQCQQLDSLSEALILFKKYLVYTKNITSENQKEIELDNLVSLVNTKIPAASLEELLELEEFNTKMRGQISYIPTDLAHVKEISPYNSSILKKKILTPKNVMTLLTLVEATKSLEKVDLTDAWFYVDEGQCIKMTSLGDDDSDIEPISEKEYFWEEEKPLSRILTILSEKHGTSLKTLNLRGIRFNGNSEGAEILKNLRNVGFPVLENLHLTSNLIDESDANALNILSNLHTYFPTLQNIFYGWESDYNLKPQHLPFLAEAIRSMKQKQTTQ